MKKWKKKKKKKKKKDQHKQLAEKGNTEKCRGLYCIQGTSMDLRQKT